MSQDDAVLRIKLSGQADRHNAAAIACEVIEASAASGRSLMQVDVGNLDGQLGTTHADFQVQHYPHAPQAVEVAVADLSEYQLYHCLHETTVSTAGQPLRFFNELGEGEAWLRV
jgi:hypothetical protein